MHLFTAPQTFRPSGRYTIFLAGSIETGRAYDWQNDMIDFLSSYDIDVLNPRRKEWDPSWVQSRDNMQFYEQVQWELYGLGCADLILMYLLPETISPISLLELGLFAQSGKMVVCCPDGFQRSGNVEIVCEQYRIACLKNVEDFFTYTQNKVVQFAKSSLQ